MDATETEFEERLRAVRGTREFFVLFEQRENERARRARNAESTSARIARRRGWLPIAPTPNPRHYVSALAALNLECPWNRVADWHTAMWRATPEEIEEHNLWVDAHEWPTSAVLGTEGIYDARAALRRCRARWRIGTLGIGGHPQGYGASPVYVAGHARAVIDMVHSAFQRGAQAVPAGGPQPLEAALWLAADGQREWACQMAQRLEAAAKPPETALWSNWWRDIKLIETEGREATRRWNPARRKASREIA